MYNNCIYGIINFILPYKKKLFFLFFFLILFNLFFLFFPLFLSKFLIFFFLDTNIVFKEFFDLIFNKDIPLFLFNKVNQFFFLFFLILFIQSSFFFLKFYFFSLLNEHIILDIRISLYKKFIVLPIFFYKKRFIRQLIIKISNDLLFIQNIFFLNFFKLFEQFFILFGSLLILFYISPLLLLFLFFILFFSIFIIILLNDFTKIIYKLKNSNLFIIFQDLIYNIYAIKIFTNEFLEINKYAKKLRKLINTFLKFLIFRKFFILFISLFSFTFILVFFWYIFNLVQLQIVDFINFISFILYTTFIFSSVFQLENILFSLYNSINSFNRIFEILKKKEESLLNFTKVQLDYKYLNVSYEKISFSYISDSLKSFSVLNNITFNINYNEVILFFGGNKFERSCIINLLLKFYNPDNGFIKINDICISNFNIVDLRNNIGIISNELTLFDGSIKENIDYGKPGSTDLELFEACLKSNILNFVNSLPEGLDTFIGKNGINLSDEEEKCIIISRIILKNPSILILNDINHYFNFKLIRNLLINLMKNKTTIITSDKFLNFIDFNEIYILENGNIKKGFNNFF